MRSTVVIEVRGEEPSDEEYRAFSDALRNWTGEVFDESQRRCPVRTGRLLNSGRIEGDEGGCGIVYDIWYAEVVERGRGEPGEKWYFEGRRYIDGAIDEKFPRFEILLIQSLHQDFEVREA